MYRLLFSLISRLLDRLLFSFTRPCHSPSIHLPPPHRHSVPSKAQSLYSKISRRPSKKIHVSRLPNLAKMSPIRLLFRPIHRLLLNSPQNKRFHLRSKSLCPACVILLPPFSSSFSNTPISSSDFTTFRSTAPLASTWWEGREPRFLVLP